MSTPEQLQSNPQAFKPAWVPEHIGNLNSPTLDDKSMQFLGVPDGSFTVRRSDGTEESGWNLVTVDSNPNDGAGRALIIKDVTDEQGNIVDTLQKRVKLANLQEWQLPSDDTQQASQEVHAILTPEDLDVVRGFSAEQKRKLQALASKYAGKPMEQVLHTALYTFARVAESESPYAFSTFHIKPALKDTRIPTQAELDAMDPMDRYNLVDGRAGDIIATRPGEAMPLESRTFLNEIYGLTGAEFVSDDGMDVVYRGVIDGKEFEFVESTNAGFGGNYERHSVKLQRVAPEEMESKNTPITPSGIIDRVPSAEELNTRVAHAHAAVEAAYNQENVDSQAALDELTRGLSEDDLILVRRYGAALDDKRHAQNQGNGEGSSAYGRVAGQALRDMSPRARERATEICRMWGFDL